jgi:Domain of unknown function (DUF4149)
VTGGRAMGADLTSVVALSLWLGAALVVGGVVAPAAFAVLPTRTLAGALVGRVLPALFWSGAAIGLLVAVFGRAAPSARMRSVLGLAVTVACLAAQLGVAPRIARVRADGVVPIERLAREDARRIAFGRLHLASVALLGVAGLAGVAALFFTVRALTANGAGHGTTYPLHEP